MTNRPKPDDQQPKPDDQQPRTTEKEVPCAPQPECLTKLGDDIILDDIKSKPPVPDIPRATCEYEIHTCTKFELSVPVEGPMLGDSICQIKGKNCQGPGTPCATEYCESIGVAINPGFVSGSAAVASCSTVPVTCGTV